MYLIVRSFVKSNVSRYNVTSSVFDCDSSSERLPDAWYVVE